jgi:hypothetical protein
LLNHIYLLITKYNDRSHEYWLACWLNAARETRYVRQGLTSRTLSLYASIGERSWTPSTVPVAGEVRMALRMRHENGIEVGMRSRSDEYLRRRKVLCSVYAGGAWGVLVMYFLFD